MKIGPRQLEALRALILDHHQAFIANYINPELIPPETRDRLAKLGLIDPKAATVQDAYFLGVLASHAPDEAEALSYPQLLARVQARPLPVTDAERHAILVAEMNAGQYLTGLGSKAAADAGQAALAMSPSSIFEYHANKEAIDEGLDAQDYRRRVQSAVSDAIAQRKEVGELKSDLGHATQDWNRNLERVANTELSMAMSEGTARAAVAQAKGKRVRCCKTSAVNCCKWCMKLWLIEGTRTPKIYFLDELEANGTNVGRKASQYLPTVSPSHPSCFPAGTLVSTESGNIPIESVTPGMRVWTHKGRLREVLARWQHNYSGDAVTLSHVLFGSLLATAEHPILVGGQWRPACSLQGTTDGVAVKRRFLDDALEHRDAKRPPSISAKNVRFAHVVEILFPGVVPTSAIYFDGQLLLGKGQVAGENIHRECNFSDTSKLLKPIKDKLLVGRGKMSLPGLGALESFSAGPFGASDLVVRAFHNVLSLLKRIHRPTEAGGLSIGARSDALVFEDLVDAFPGAHEPLAYGQHRKLVNLMQPDNFLEIQRRGERQPGRPANVEQAPQNAVLEAEALGNLQDAMSVFVEEAQRVLNVQPGACERPSSVVDARSNDQIGNPSCGNARKVADALYTHQLVAVTEEDEGALVFGQGCGGGHGADVLGAHGDKPIADTCNGVKTSRSSFSGPVYNLSVDEDESYFAQGVAVHNCRCVLRIVPDDMEFDATGRLRPVGTKKLPP